MSATEKAALALSREPMIGDHIGIAQDPDPLPAAIELADQGATVGRDQRVHGPGFMSCTGAEITGSMSSAFCFQTAALRV